MTIGVLALQGGFQAHADALLALGEEVRLVRTPAELKGCEGLVLPGGESSTMLILMAAEPGWFDTIKLFAKNHWIMGTCAGMILLADQVEPQQPSLQLLPITVQRNAYGRQRDSRIIKLPYKTLAGEVVEAEVIFIRAPKIKTLSASIQVLLEEGGEPLLVQKQAIIAASFHPESAQPLVIYSDCLMRLRAATT